MKSLQTVAVIFGIIFCINGTLDDRELRRNRYRKSVHGKRRPSAMFTKRLLTNPDLDVHNQLRHEVPVLTSSEIDAIVETHNDLRRQVSPTAANMRVMKWDSRLAKIAAEYVGRCRFQHSDSARRGNAELGSKLGENIYISSGGPMDLPQGIKSWYAEVEHYDYSTGHCNKVCGHYTQLVWADSDKIGCAYVNCHGQVQVRDSFWTDPKMLICNYLPPGNIRKSIFSSKLKKPYKSGKQCSQCKLQDDICLNGLCGEGSIPTTNQGDRIFKLPFDHPQQRPNPSSNRHSRPDSIFLDFEPQLSGQSNQLLHLDREEFIMKPEPSSLNIGEWYPSNYYDSGEEYFDIGNQWDASEGRDQKIYHSQPASRISGHIINRQTGVQDNSLMPRIRAVFGNVRPTNEILDPRPSYVETGYYERPEHLERLNPAGYINHLIRYITAGRRIPVLPEEFENKKWALVLFDEDSIVEEDEKGSSQQSSVSQVGGLPNPSEPESSGSDACLDGMCKNQASSHQETVENIEILPCLCENGGQCVPDLTQESGLGAYECECVGAHQGKYCNESCPPGFTGRSCFEDVDECETNTNTCFAGVQCFNTYGSFYCGVCPEGYIGDGTMCKKDSDVSVSLGNGDSDILQLLNSSSLFDDLPDDIGELVIPFENFSYYNYDDDGVLPQGIVNEDEKGNFTEDVTGEFDSELSSSDFTLNITSSTDKSGEQYPKTMPSDTLNGDDQKNASQNMLIAEIAVSNDSSSSPPESDHGSIIPIDKGGQDLLINGDIISHTTMSSEPRLRADNSGLLNSDKNHTNIENHHNESTSSETSTIPSLEESKPASNKSLLSTTVQHSGQLVIPDLVQPTQKTEIITDTKSEKMPNYQKSDIQDHGTSSPKSPSVLPVTGSTRTSDHGPFETAAAVGNNRTNAHPKLISVVNSTIEGSKSKAAVEPAAKLTNAEMVAVLTTIRTANVGKPTNSTVPLTSTKNSSKVAGAGTEALIGTKPTKHISSFQAVPQSGLQSTPTPQVTTASKLADNVNRTFTNNIIEDGKGEGDLLEASTSSEMVIPKLMDPSIVKEPDSINGDLVHLHMANYSSSTVPQTTQANAVISDKKLSHPNSGRTSSANDVTSPSDENIHSTNHSAKKFHADSAVPTPSSVTQPAESQEKSINGSFVLQPIKGLEMQHGASSSRTTQQLSQENKTSVPLQHNLVTPAKSYRGQGVQTTILNNNTRSTITMLSSNQNQEIAGFAKERPDIHNESKSEQLQKTTRVPYHKETLIYGDQSKPNSTTPPEIFSHAEGKLEEPSVTTVSQTTSLSSGGHHSIESAASSSTTQSELADDIMVQSEDDTKVTENRPQDVVIPKLIQPVTEKTKAYTLHVVPENYASKIAVKNNSGYGNTLPTMAAAVASLERTSAEPLTTNSTPVSNQTARTTPSGILPKSAVQASPTTVDPDTNHVFSLNNKSSLILKAETETTTEVQKSAVIKPNVIKIPNVLKINQSVVTTTSNPIAKSNQIYNGVPEFISPTETTKQGLDSDREEATAHGAIVVDWLKNVTNGLTPSAEPTELKIPAAVTAGIQSSDEGKNVTDDNLENEFIPDIESVPPFPKEELEQVTATSPNAFSQNENVNLAPDVSEEDESVISKPTSSNTIHSLNEAETADDGSIAKIERILDEKTTTVLTHESSTNSLTVSIAEEKIPPVPHYQHLRLLSSSVTAKLPNFLANTTTASDVHLSLSSPLYSRTISKSMNATGNSGKTTVLTQRVGGTKPSAKTGVTRTNSTSGLSIVKLEVAKQESNRTSESERGTSIVAPSVTTFKAPEATVSTRPIKITPYQTLKTTADDKVTHAETEGNKDAIISAPLSIQSDEKPPAINATSPEPALQSVTTTATSPIAKNENIESETAQVGVEINDGKKTSSATLRLMFENPEDTSVPVTTKYIPTSQPNPANNANQMRIATSTNYRTQSTTQQTIQLTTSQEQTTTLKPLKSTEIKSPKENGNYQRMVTCRKTSRGTICRKMRRRIHQRKNEVMFGGRPLKYYVARRKTKVTRNDCQKLCGERGKCISSGICKCKPQFAGRFCERSACTETCKHNGTCISRNLCKCAGGYFGQTCQEFKCRSPCHNNGKCVGPDTCQCPRGFTGPTCLTPVCNPSCANGGICESGNICKCPTGYAGERCEKAICSPGCMNGGSCVKKDVCSCPSTFLGSRCQIAVCSPRCAHGGRCLKDNKCLCKKGWKGNSCTIAVCVNECANGGVCISPNKCKCKGGWSGSTCRTGHCASRCRYGSRCISNRCKCPYGARGRYCRMRTRYRRRPINYYPRFI